jgi:uncharacterized protein
MGRLFILIVLVLVAVWLVRRALARLNEPEGGSNRDSTAVRDELVRCAHCGLLLPRAEARQSAGAIYCSEEHARLGPTRGPGGR